MTGFSEEAGTNFGREHLLAGLEPLLSNQDLGLVFVAEIRQRASRLRGHRLGWGIESGGKEALIDEVFVLKNHRNQGIGAKMLSEVMAHLERHNTKAVFLETEPKTLILESFTKTLALKPKTRFGCAKPSRKTPQSARFQLARQEVAPTHQLHFWRVDPRLQKSAAKIHLRH